MTHVDVDNLPERGQTVPRVVLDRMARNGAESSLIAYKAVQWSGSSTESGKRVLQDLIDFHLNTAAVLQEAQGNL